MAKFDNKLHGHAKVVTDRNLTELIRSMFHILSPDNKFYTLAIIYGIGISVLSLAIPISVQILVNTVANIGRTGPLFMLSVVLLVLLLLYGLLSALRIHLMDIFGRRFYARMVSEITLRAVYATNPYFEDIGKSALFNRYFDVIIVLKVLPYLLVGGFTIVLQAIAGFILVSFYHPFFLVFNLVMLFLLWLIWLVWGKRAMHSAMELSHRKHATASWLQSIADSNGFYNTEEQIKQVLHRSELFTSSYIQQHIVHFRNYFGQTLGFLVFYAVASAFLLGLSGWLVLESQLNLGQLVAAELVLSVVFFGISQLGTYLTYFYDLCGAIDELGLFYDVEQQNSDEVFERLEGGGELRFVQLKNTSSNRYIKLDFSIPSNAKVLVTAEHNNVAHFMSSLLEGRITDYEGFFSVAGVESRSISLHALRREVFVLSRLRMVSISIRHFLALFEDDLPKQRVLEVIRIVGLEDTISRLEDGIETDIAVTGWPLSNVEVMQLKLAAALIVQPRVLLLGGLCDMIPQNILQNAINALQEKQETIVLYLSNHHYRLGYDYELRLGTEKQVLLPYSEVHEEASTDKDE